MLAAAMHECLHRKEGVRLWPILTLLNYTKEHLWKTPQLACQAKDLCRALLVHACWCTSSCRVAAVQCQRGPCPCKATARHLTSPPPWYALLRGKHRGPTSTTLHWGKSITPNQLYSNSLKCIPHLTEYSHRYTTKKTKRYLRSTIRQNCSNSLLAPP